METTNKKEKKIILSSSKSEPKVSYGEQGKTKAGKDQLCGCAWLSESLRGKRIKIAEMQESR